MKRKFVKISFVVAIAMIGGINVFNAQKPIELSDIAMANVEALADEEYDYENGFARKDDSIVTYGPYYFLNPAGGYYENYYVYNEVKCYDPGILKCQENITYLDTYIKEYNGIH